MEGRQPGQNRDTETSGTVDRSSAAGLRGGRATIIADLRRLQARISVHRQQAASSGPSGGYSIEGLLDEALELIHWQDPSPEMVALYSGGFEGSSVRDGMEGLVGRLTPMFLRRLLDFAGNPEPGNAFEVELDRGSRQPRVLRVSFKAEGSTSELSRVIVRFSQPAGYIPTITSEGISPTLQCFFDNSREGMVLLNTNDRHTIITANPAFCGMLGLSLMSLEGRSINSLKPAAIEGSLAGSYRGLASGDDDSGQEMVFITSSGEMLNASTRTVEIRSASGHLEGLVLLIHDVSEHLRTTRSKHRSETRLAIGEALAHMGSWEHVFGRDQLIWTDELYRIFEMPVGSRVSVSRFTRHVLPGDRRELFNQYRQARDRGSEISCFLRILTQTGKLRFLRIKGRVISNEPGQLPRMVGMAQDVTERRRAEKIQDLLLEISEATSRSANLEELLATVHRSLGSLVPASNFYIALYNPASQLYEFPFHTDELDDSFESQRMDHSLTDIVRREGRPLVISRGEQEEMIRHQQLRQHGPIAMSWLGVPMSDAGDVNGVIVLQDYKREGLFSQQDVELVSYIAGYVALAIQRKRSSDMLRESEWQYRNLVDTMFEGLSTADENGNFVYANPALGRIMGMHPEDLVGRNISEFLSPHMQQVSSQQRELRRDGISNRYELQVLRADGQTRDLYLSVNPRYDRNGSFVGSHALVQDVTEMREAEKAIRESEQRYRRLVEQMSEGLASVDRDGNFEFANPALERILGLGVGNVVGHNLFDFIDQAQQRELRAQIEMRSRGESGSYTLRLKQADGAERIALISASPRFSPDGEFLGSLALVRDVTEQVRTEEVLRQSEEKYRTLVNTIKEGIFVTDASRRFSFANPALEQMLGVGPGALSGRCLDEFLDEQEQLQFAKRSDAMKVSGRGSSFQLSIRQQDGQLRECFISASPTMDSYGEMTGANGIVQDITDQVRTLELLRANEEKFRHIYHNSPVMMYSVDKEGFITDVNQKWLDETRYERENVIGKRADFLMTPNSAQRMREEFGPGTASEWHMRDAPFTYVCRDGSQIDVLIDCESSVDPSGRGISLAIVRNVTEQKAAENQLRQVVIAVENAHEAIMTTDTRGTITYVNPAFEVITGYSRAEAVGNSPNIISSGAHDEEFYSELWKVISRGEVWHGKFINRRKDGSQYQEEATISPVWDGQGEIAGYVAVKRDVTRQIALEEQLKHSQKMEAIGTLAGGIAHDFNNILFAIVGNAEIARDRLPPDSRVVPQLKAIIDASGRATELVKQVLSYARRKESNRSPLRVDLLVREVLRLIRASLPATIEIRSASSARDTTVLADATEIHQMLMNLCTNAGHAMIEHGGILSIELSEFTADEAFLEEHTDAQGERFLRLDVSDTGKGISDELLSRIFEPFFTTKEVGQGTGMGLSVVHGIVHSLRGALDVSSRPGEGTTFSVFLPISGGGRIEEEEIPLATETGRERILLVDDEQMVVQVVSDMLRMLGYRVTAFNSSPQAWQEFSREPDRFDLVLTDQTMPQMTGDELARRILELRPRTPVIICTGYSQTLSQERAMELGIRQYLLKPVKLHDLGYSIRRALDEAFVERSQDPPDSPSSSGAK